MPHDAEHPSSLNRRERRKLEVHTRIVEAAIDLFDEYGFVETKVAAICERADIAHKTFFNHFPRKQDLLREIASIYLGTLLGDIEETRKQPGTTRDRILFFFERIADKSEAAGPMRRELVTEIVHVAHETHSEPEQARKLHGSFGSIILDGVAGGDVTDRYDPETMIDMLMGAFYALVFNWANLDDFPVRRHAMSSARFLADAFQAEVFPADAAGIEVKETAD
ncbi:MAG: TetR/AcrR family transcriptional regulator [bacterium]|nr:TetR/AcrR family transcriptional regulator [bacterium]